jgi:hypothetical protein
VNAIDKEELNFKPDRQMPRVAPWCSFGLNTEIARAHLRFRIPLSQQRRASRCVYALVKMSNTTLMFDGSHQDVAAGPDNRPTKEPGLRRVLFVKTAPIINWPV